MNKQWAKDVLFDWFCIVGAIACGSLCDWYAWPLCGWIVGNRLHGLVILGHDATHKLVSRNRVLNRFLGSFVCFAPIFLGWKGYRTLHMKHHKFLGTDKDPELENKKAAGIVIENATTKNIVKQFFKDLFFLSLKDIKHLSTKKEKGDWTPIIIFHSILFILGVLLSWKILVIFYGGLLTSFLACARLRVWFEHVGTSKTHKIKPSWWQKVLFLPHGAEYHHEHHEKPAVPYNKLKDIAENERRTICEIQRERND